jgi:8-oxo-dGTP pyrophosphatase MutT (NUDIX family)
VSLVPLSADSPVLKVGAVVVRAVARRPSPVAGEDAGVVPPPRGGRLGGGPSEHTGSYHSLSPHTHADSYSSASAALGMPPPQPSPSGGEGFDVASVAATGHRPPATSFSILIIQPKPKRAGEVPPFVLPRGSRQYQDEAGAWVDARDVATGEKYQERLEPFTRCLTREVEEEAGVTPEMLARAEVRALGRLEFQSRSKGVYPIHWFVVTLADADAAGLADTVPVDALCVRWAGLDQIKGMAACGEFSAGYVEVIEAAFSFPPPT